VWSLWASKAKKEAAEQKGQGAREGWSSKKIYLTKAEEGVGGEHLQKKSNLNDVRLIQSIETKKRRKEKRERFQIRAIGGMRSNDKKRSGWLEGEGAIKRAERERDFERGAKGDQKKQQQDQDDAWSESGASEQEEDAGMSWEMRDAAQNVFSGDKGKTGPGIAEAQRTLGRD